MELTKVTTEPCDDRGFWPEQYCCTLLCRLSVEGSKSIRNTASIALARAVQEIIPVGAIKTKCHEGYNCFVLVKIIFMTNNYLV